MLNVAIIGGTGIYDFPMTKKLENRQLETPYGQVIYKIGEYAGQEIAFITRHGSRHSIPPHMINYRANIWAAKKLGISRIIATACVGSLKESLKPGELVLVDQFLDFTHGRVSTFYEGGERGVVHVDMTRPYCPHLQQLLKRSAQALQIPIHENGVYVCTEGPRYESAAEIRMFGKLGGDIVGMTSVPEVVLANEAELCYSTLAMITNYGAGMKSDELSHFDVINVLKENVTKITKIILKTLEDADIQDRTACSCSQKLRAFGGFKL